MHKTINKRKACDDDEQQPRLEHKQKKAITPWIENCYFAWLAQGDGTIQLHITAKKIDPECSVLHLPGMHADPDKCLCRSFSSLLSRSESLRDMIGFAMGTEGVTGARACALASAWTSNVPLSVRPQLLLERLWRISRILPVECLPQIMRSLDCKQPCTVQSFHRFWKTVHLICTRNTCACASLCPTICGLLEQLTRCISSLWNDAIYQLQAAHTKRLLVHALATRNALATKAMQLLAQQQQKQQMIIPFILRGADKRTATIRMQRVDTQEEEEVVPHPVLVGADLAVCSAQQSAFCIVTKKIRNSMFMPHVLQCFSRDSYCPLNLFFLYIVAVVRHKLPISLFCAQLVSFLDFSAPELSPNLSVHYLVGSANSFARKLVL